MAGSLFLLFSTRVLRRYQRVSHGAVYFFLHAVSISGQRQHLHLHRESNGGTSSSAVDSRGLEQRRKLAELLSQKRSESLDLRRRLRGNRRLELLRQFSASTKLGAAHSELVARQRYRSDAGGCDRT